MRFPRAVAPLALLLLATPAYADKEPRLEDYQSEAGRFKVRMPVGPRKVDSKELATGKGKQSIAVTTEKVDVPGGAVFAVTYADYPKSFEEVAPKTILDGVRDGLKGTDGKVTRDDETTLGTDKISGRDLRIEAGKNVIRARVFLADNRLYQVMVTGGKDAVSTKFADEFLKSFEVTK